MARRRAEEAKDKKGDKIELEYEGELVGGHAIARSFAVVAADARSRGAT